jgi:hypothetical protein
MLEVQALAVRKLGERFDCFDQAHRGKIDVSDAGLAQAELTSIISYF